jgi:hypothetical protein
MAARSNSERFKLVAATVLSVAVVVSLGFFGYVFVVASGVGGWTPNARSPQAVRARAVDGQLRPGMTRDEVIALFNADKYANASDGVLESLAGSSARVWNDEADLYVNERRQFFWNSYDTAWTVRAGFNSDGHLIHHRVDAERTNGP